MVQGLGFKVLRILVAARRILVAVPRILVNI